MYQSRKKLTSHHGTSTHVFHFFLSIPSTFGAFSSQLMIVNYRAFLYVRKDGPVGSQKGKANFHGNPTNWNFKGAVTAAVSFREGVVTLQETIKSHLGKKENSSSKWTFQGHTLVPRRV